MTECTQTRFPFEGHFSGRVVTRFDATQISTEGGAPMRHQLAWTRDDVR